MGAVKKAWDRLSELLEREEPATLSELRKAAVALCVALEVWHDKDWEIL